MNKRPQWPPSLVEAVFENAVMTRFEGQRQFLGILMTASKFIEADEAI